ncbi:FAD-dependent monooxygenase [Kitasatospora sp. NPDC093806]|uniref:FAD-dependent monooxygenase n=1 Tax=Kitasatospora sp. NPDC093806 TaxID=3155075 RepID=UPI00341C7B50
MTSAPKILVSGAGIAGTALAHWLHRHGADVTVVEKADSVRPGGYPIDIRGTAVEVVDRMGLLPRLRPVHVDTRRISFLDPDGRPIAALSPEAVAGGDARRDLEVARGDLTGALYETVCDSVEFRFGDSVAALDEHARGIDVTFRGGDRRTFDLVVGADGIHSHTRGLAIGPEAPHHRDLGYRFAGFALPNHRGLDREAVIWNAPGRAAVLYAAGPAPERVHGLLVLTGDDPAPRDEESQRALVAARFAGDGWEVPRLLDALRGAEDLFFDTVGQIRLPRWSRGRVALVGDAAYAPSFFSGQGTSLALVGAYVLAGELAAGRDHAAAFAGYEARLREFVELNQALADGGAAGLVPRTAEELAGRNAALRDPGAVAAAGSEGGSVAGPEAGPSPYSALTLPDYR